MAEIQLVAKNCWRMLCVYAHSVLFLEPPTYKISEFKLVPLSELRTVDLKVMGRPHIPSFFLTHKRAD